MREESTLHQLFSTLLGRSKHSRMTHGHYRIYRVVPSVGPVCSKRFHRHYTRYRQYRDHALNIECSTFKLFFTLLGRSRPSRMAHGHYRIYRVVPSVGPVCSKRFHRHYTGYRQYRDHALNVECSTFAIGPISVLNEIVKSGGDANRPRQDKVDSRTERTAQTRCCKTQQSRLIAGCCCFCGIEKLSVRTARHVDVVFTTTKYHCLCSQ